MQKSQEDVANIHVFLRVRPIKHPVLKALILLYSLLGSAVLAQADRNASTQTRPLNNTLNVVYVGDSITLGVGVPDRAHQSAPVACTALLRDRLSDISVYMDNMGRNGATTVDFLPATGTDFSDVEEAAHRLQNAHEGALVFSIMLGTNDSASSGTKGAPVSPSQFAANLMEITSQLFNDFPSSIVVIQHPPSYSPNTYNGAYFGEVGLQRLQSYNPMIAEVVGNLEVDHSGQVYEGDASSFSIFARNYAGMLTPEAGKDGIFYLHPNVAGAKVLGELWGNVILKALSSSKYPGFSQQK